MSLTNIGLLISGNGSNLQAIIDSIDNGYINGRISVVISNKEDAYGLVRARKKGIDSIYVDSRQFSSDIDFDRRMIDELKKRNVDLVILGGYTKVLGEELVKEFEGRIVNIHPSLIPSFSGKGYYGEKIHKAILDYGVKITGATVHFVDIGTDTGPIILQETIKVEEEDTIETLRKRTLEVEHRILSEAVKLFCEKKLTISDRRVIIRK